MPMNLVRGVSDATDDLLILSVLVVFVVGAVTLTRS
jgi:hypothetical protein